MSEAKNAFRPMDANAINRRYLDNIQVEMRILDADQPDLRMELFGKTFASPIMTPAFSHLRKVGENGRTQMEEYARAADALHLVNFVGMESNDLFGKIMNCCSDSIRIIKPYKDTELILDEIRYAREVHALAVGMDIDHPFGKNGAYDVVDEYEMRPVTTEQLAAYVKAAELPFVVKGVLSVTDALKCKEAGAAAIMVSHHHGRIPFGVPPLKVLPAIREAVGDSMKIFVDCGIDTGYDAFKALALGADAVCVGRAMLPALTAGGMEGVIEKLNEMNGELMEMMEYTNIHDLSEMDSGVLYFD